MPLKKRVFRVALPGDVALRILTDHVPASAMAHPDRLWEYGEKGQEMKLWKLAPRWPQLWKARAFLEDVIEATKGRCLLQSSWYLQLVDFFVKADVQAKEVLRACYRSRAMLAHLRDVRRNPKKIPDRFAKLQCLVDEMVIAPSDDPEDDSDLHIVQTEPKMRAEVIEVDSNSEGEYEFCLFDDKWAETQDKDSNSCRLCFQL